MFRSKAKHEASNKAAFFVFFGLALSLVLLIAVFRLDSGLFGSSGIASTTGAPDLARLLPAGWVVIADTAVSLDDLVLPAVVFATRNERTGGLALAVWDKKTKGYRLASQLALADVDQRLMSQVELAVMQVGAGAEQVLRVAAPLDNLDAKGVFFVARNGERLDVVRMKTGTGEVQPAFFIDGSLPSGDSRLAFYDVSDDGDDDVVVTRRSLDGAGQGGSLSRSVSVFEWSGGMFVYDQEMSWALTKSAEVFPEPPARQ